VAHALDRHLALVGFMGAGKSTLGAQAAERLGRRFVDLDRELERSLRQTIPQIFGARGEADFRELEAEAALEALANGSPAVVALGGGAVETEQIRRALREHAFTVHVEIDPATAWIRVGGGDRPLAQDEQSFHELHEQRSPLYDEVAQAVAHDVDGIVLAAAGIELEEGLLARLPELVDGDVEVVADATVLALHRPPLEAPVHALRGGEEAKSLGAVERLWRELRLGRDGTIVAFGGGCTTDMAGFAAATYLRGVPWVAVPTTLVGQVDAAIGGKTAINLPEGKNLVGAFHWPERTAIDPALLETLPPEEQRTSATPSRTRSRRPATTTAPATARRSPSACSRRCASRARTRLRSTRCCDRSPCASTAMPPGPHSRATRNPSTARRGSSCSRLPASRWPASNCLSSRYARPSTR